MEQRQVVNGDSMENLSAIDFELLAWQSVLESLDGKRRERLKELLREQLSRPATLQQRIIRWEKVLERDASGIPTGRRIDALESCLEEVIAAVKELAHEHARY